MFKMMTLQDSKMTYQIPADTLTGQTEIITINLYDEDLATFADFKGAEDLNNFRHGDIEAMIAEMENKMKHEDTRPVITETKDDMLEEMEDEGPKTVIIEQPKQKGMRFRYATEGRTAGSLQGARTTEHARTVPAVKVDNYHGPAMVLVSCVTEMHPYRPHPHKLVSPKNGIGCEKGVCLMKIDRTTMTAELRNLGIQCVRRKDVQDSLNKRKDDKVDPFRTGFKHLENPQSIDLNAVRLCFQVFLPNKQTGKCTHALEPVVSQPIYDAKTKRDLEIVDISDNTSPAEGGKKIIILCDKVSKDDIKVRFVDNNGWEEYGEIAVHKQYAIVVKTPQYVLKHLNEEAEVFMEIYRPSCEKEAGEMYRQRFVYLPTSQGYQQIKSIKRSRSSVQEVPKRIKKVSTEDMIDWEYM